VDDVNDLCPTVRMQLLREFSLMDQDGDGKLNWWEFVNNESKYYLAKKDKVLMHYSVLCGISNCLAKVEKNQRF